MVRRLIFGKLSVFPTFKMKRNPGFDLRTKFPKTTNADLVPPSSPSARPTDFDFLKVIGKGNYGKVSDTVRLGGPVSPSPASSIPCLSLACAKRELTTCRIMDAEESWGPSGESSPVGPCICASPQVLLAKRKSDGMFYAVKVLQKKSILKKKEVPELGHRHFLSRSLTPSLGWLLKMSPTIEFMGWMQRGSQQVVRWCPGC